MSDSLVVKLLMDTRMARLPWEGVYAPPPPHCCSRECPTQWRGLGAAHGGAIVRSEAPQGFPSIPGEMPGEPAPIPPVAEPAERGD